MGPEGPRGHTGVHVGSNAPTVEANVWIDPNGGATFSSEEWTFILEDGTVLKKAIAIFS